MVEPAVHALLITHAAPPEGVQAADLQGLTLLRRLLAGTQALPQAGVQVDPHSRHLPHELMQAQHLGLPTVNDAIPWAAWRARELGLDDGSRRGQSWAFLSPCHWAAGADHILMHDPAALALDAAEADTLRALMAPWFESEDLALLPDPSHPARWLVCGAPLHGLLTASLDRVSGTTPDLWMPEGPHARRLRRLQSEMQMLLYQHPLHDARRARGLLPVNSFWLHGSGELPPEVTPHTPPLPTVDSLRGPWLAQDAQGWLAAWQGIESQALPALAAALGHGQRIRLVLSGQHAACVFEPRPASLWHRATAWLRPDPSAQTLHATLSSLG